MIKLNSVIICHGSLNKFVMIDEIDDFLDIDYTDRVKLSKNLCSKAIFGADGVLYVQNSSNKKYISKMSMFNADGSEAEMCGNGIRCVARFVYEKYKTEEFIIETKNDKVVVAKADFIFNDILTFDVEIAPVSLDVNLLPMNYDRDVFINDNIDNLGVTNFSVINVQNPHVVFIKNSISDLEIVDYYNKLNNKCSLFPNQVNINFTKIIDNSSIYVLTNERGSGITASCGTGMSSSTYIACELGHCDFEKNIKVFNRGGMVICRASKKNMSINLIGNATYIKRFDVVFDEDMNINKTFLVEKYDNEVIAYNDFLQSSKMSFDV